MARTPEPGPARMLVVDDDASNRKLLVGYLEAEGYRVVEAPDGPTALRLAAERPPDVVLLDVMMPVMTGYEVCARLKSDEATRLCQVMLVTALDSTPDKVEGLDTGADDYVTKPVRREEFLAKVRALLRVAHLLHDLEDARTDLAERNRELELKKTLAQTLVHDLKSPLAAILGNLDLLEMRGGDQVQATVQRSRQGAKRMQKMILDLLDVERLEQGAFRPETCRVDAAQIAREAVDEARDAAAARTVELRVQGEQAAWVEAEPGLLRRVIDNLVANAIAHSPRGGTVALRLLARDEGIELRVDDDGPGVPEEHRERVFEKYAQRQLRDSGVSTNRGLGLTFCRLAIEALGGTIWIDASPAGGASFRTVLPAADPAAPVLVTAPVATRV